MIADNPAYVAVALSMDDQMGDDSVMECVPEQGTVKAYTSWTTGMPNYGATRDQVVSEMIFSCRSPHIVIQYIVTILVAPKYYQTARRIRGRWKHLLQTGT